MKNFFALSFCSLITVGVFATELPLKEVTIFSSGVAFFEHELSILDSSSFELTLDYNQVDDFLKSLVISDTKATKISIDYASSNSLKKTLQSFQIDISEKPSIANLLKSQIGSKISFTVLKGAQKDLVSGRLLSVEAIKEENKSLAQQVLISILSDDGIQVFRLDQVLNFKFADPKKNDSLTKALQLLDTENTSNKKVIIRLNIEGSGKRNIKLSYVLEAPVWKTTYRLVLGNESAIFQAWAIVDNSTNFDWDNVKLNLITGKPISFRQNLYEPYYVTRPVVPLLVEGSSELEVYDSANESLELEYANSNKLNRPLMMEKRLTASPNYDTLNDEVFSTEASTQANSKFAFTPKLPISLPRQKSMMLPLKVTTIPAKKITVFSNLSEKSKNPKLCVELTNTSEMNLPAGSITLYDEGYSGDSMMTFLPKGEKRLISYGDDLLLSGSRTSKTEETITKLSASDGILQVQVNRLYISDYDFKNSSLEKRTVILQHPITKNTELSSTENLSEKTLNDYRFKIELPVKDLHNFTVTESKTIFSKYSLIDGNFNSGLIEYINSGKVPTKVADTFKKIAEKRSELLKLSEKISTLGTKITKLNDEQERTRKNMVALTNTEEVANFTEKLLSIEKEIVSANSELEKKQIELQKQKQDFEQYLKSIKF